jgi:hypothetical protein
MFNGGEQPTEHHQCKKGQSIMGVSQDPSDPVGINYKKSHSKYIAVYFVNK